VSQTQSENGFPPPSQRFVLSKERTPDRWPGGPFEILGVMNPPAFGWLPVSYPKNEFIPKI